MKLKSIHIFFKLGKTVVSFSFPKTNIVFCLFFALHVKKGIIAGWQSRLDIVAALAGTRDIEDALSTYLK